MKILTHGHLWNEGRLPPIGKDETAHNMIQ